MARMNWDKLRRDRSLNAEPRQLEPRREDWEPLPSQTPRRRKSKGKSAGGGGRTRAAGDRVALDGPSSGKEVSRTQLAALKPSGKAKKPFVKTRGSSSIDDFFHKARDAQAKASKSSARLTKKNASRGRRPPGAGGGMGR